MSCQTRNYTTSDGFVPIFYLNESITTGICGISNQFKGIVGGRKSRKRKYLNKYSKRNKHSKRRKYR